MEYMEDFVKYHQTVQMERTVLDFELLKENTKKLSPNAAQAFWTWTVKRIEGVMKKLEHHLTDYER